MENVRFSISVSSYDISRQLPAQFKVQACPYQQIHGGNMQLTFIQSILIVNVITVCVQGLISQSIKFKY